MLLSKFGICTQRAQKYKMNFSNPTHTIPLNQISCRGLNNSNHSNNHRRSKTNGNDAHLLTMDNENDNGRIDDMNV